MTAGRAKRNWSSTNAHIELSKAYLDIIRATLRVLAEPDSITLSGMSDSFCRVNYDNLRIVIDDRPSMLRIDRCS